MTYTLIGSFTSPFVRRTRMMMEKIPYEFREMNIFEAESIKELNRINPINQIPVLLVDSKPIWDSRVIFNYLNSEHNIQKMSLEDENVLTAIDGALNAGVALTLMKRSGIDINEPFMYVGRQKNRIESILDFLKPYIEGEGMKEWNIKTMSIYALLDWGTYRNLISIDHRPDCQAFLKAHADRPVVQLTQIPKGA